MPKLPISVSLSEAKISISVSGSLKLPRKGHGESTENYNPDPAQPFFKIVHEDSQCQGALDYLPLFQVINGHSREMLIRWNREQERETYLKPNP